MTYHPKKTTTDPYVERPKNRKAFMTVRRWLVHRRDSGEETSAERLRGHIERNYAGLTTSEVDGMIRELGL